MRVLSITVAFFTAPFLLLAQTPSEGGMGIGQKMKENTEALRQYTYKRRTTIQVKDRSFSRVDQIRYVDGKMQTTPIETPQRPAANGRGGLRGRMMEKRIEKKKEEMKEEVEKLRALAQNYLGGESKSLLENATFSRTGTGPDADVKVVVPATKNRPGSFTLIWSVINHRPVKAEINAQLDGKPVQIKVSYASLPQGPFYVAQTLISAPKKDLMITIEGFDYAKAVK